MTPRDINNRAAIEAAIVRTRAAFPDLGANGLGAYCGDIDRAQVSTAISFLAYVRAVSPKRAPCGSYGLKHMIERWGRSVGLEAYVANGAAIAAAAALGFPIERHGGGSPNASAADAAAWMVLVMTAPLCPHCGSRMLVRHVFASTDIRIRMAGRFSPYRLHTEVDRTA